jgi:hypothetical protein
VGEGDGLNCVRLLVGLCALINLPMSRDAACQNKVHGSDSLRVEEINAAANGGVTSLMVASQQGHADVVQLLKAAGAR